MTDAELVRQALRGRMTAYEELARRWSARVLAVCHARVACRHAAEDLAQETLLRGLKALETLETPEKFGPWLRGIAQRVCLDWLKAKQNSQVPFSSLTPDGQSDRLLIGNREAIIGEIDNADELRRLMSEVESLPQEYREVLMLYYYQDLTYRDLAELLGVSMATVNARLTRARSQLRERLSSSRR